MKWWSAASNFLLTFCEIGDLLLTPTLIYNLLIFQNRSKNWQCFTVSNVCCCCLCIQLRISGLFLQPKVTRPQGVPPMASSATEHASWCLEGWWNTESIPTSFTSWMHPSGSGRNWSRNLQRLVFHPALDLVSTHFQSVLCHNYGIVIWSVICIECVVATRVI